VKSIAYTSMMNDNGEAQSGARRTSEPHRSGLMERLRALLGFGPPSVREDIEDALEESAGDVLKNVLALHDLRVADAMVPRADIVAVAHDATLGEVLKVFRSAGHSRLPVYVDTLDDPRGMVHIRDFVNYLAACAEKPRAASAEAGATEAASRVTPVLSPAAIDFSAPIGSTGVMKSVLFVPRSMPALDLLVKMQATRTHMALVIDEYGGTDGLVSMEDIVEMIVGDIEDEHDTDDEPRIEAADDGSYLIDAKADLDNVAEAIGVDFRQDDTSAEVTTLGGLVASLAGHVPMRGEVIPAPIAGWEFQILEADPRRIARLRVQAIGESAKTPEEA
jgi:CBS domain containing-hemolysin-like protein